MLSCWQGNTAVMLAVKQGDLEVANALLGAKANVEATNVIFNYLFIYFYLFIYLFILFIYFEQFLCVLLLSCASVSFFCALLQLFCVC